MNESARTYDEIAEALASRPGVQRAKMFGMPGVKLGKTAFCGLFHDTDMVFKLGQGSPSYSQAMALPGASVWDPSERDRPFKDWVRLPPKHAARWEALAEAALAHASG
jgi:hypothetical protein